MPRCGDSPVCLVDADKVGLEWIELGKSGIVVLLFECKANVDRVFTGGFGIFTLVSLNGRGIVTEMVDVRVRVNSMTDVVDIWFCKSSTATAEMTVVVEGEDTIGKFENRVTKAVNVEVNVATLSPELAAAWTPGDPSKATTYPRTWKTANDFMTCKMTILFRPAEKMYIRLRGERKNNTGGVMMIGRNMCE